MDWEKEAKALRKENEELRQRLQKFDWALKRIEELERRVKELEMADKSKPSFVKPPVKKTQKKPGQKNGHKGHTRPIPEDVDEEYDVKFQGNRCPDCNSKLSLTEIRTRYVEDIVFPKKVVKKYNKHQGWCPKCKRIKTPKPNDVIPRFRFGLTLMLFVCFQKFGLLLTINKIQKELTTYFQMRVSEGEISQIITKTGKLFKGKFEELKQEMRNMAVSYTDETSWRTNGQNHWLWAFINKKIAIYKIDRSRGHEVAMEVLGENYDGVVSSDRYVTYNTLEKKTRCKQQKC